MSDTVTGHTLKLMREEIEAPLRAEIERMREHIRKQAEDIIVLGREAGKAADKALIASNDHLRAEVERLRALVLCLLDNDPYDAAADGVTVLDVWRKEARRALEGKG